MVAVVTMASGMVVAVRMTETLRAAAAPGSLLKR
jgi:hypothetical protein